MRLTKSRQDKDIQLLREVVVKNFPKTIQWVTNSSRMTVVKSIIYDSQANNEDKFSCFHFTSPLHISPLVWINSITLNFLQLQERAIYARVFLNKYKFCFYMYFFLYLFVILLLLLLWLSLFSILVLLLLSLLLLHWSLLFSLLSLSL